MNAFSVQCSVFTLLRGQVHRTRGLSPGFLLSPVFLSPVFLSISFDIDAMDPAFVPGTGTPEPGGLIPREAFPIVRRPCAESNVVGFELVELNTLVDPTHVSAMNANRVVKECLVGIAMRKMGLTDLHYLSPLTKTPGQGG